MSAPVRLNMALVYPSEHGRPVIASQVELLKESLQTIGLRTPITVKPCVRVASGRDIDAYEIVAGRHRYEAAVALKWTEIDAFVVPADDDTELWEIEENFARAELTDAQRAQAHARREELLILKGVVRTVGRPSKSRQVGDVSYAEQAAQTLGQSRRSVERDLRRGKNIVPEVLAAVTGTDLDKGVVLDQLAATPRDEQAARLAEIQQRRTQVRLAPDPLNDLEATEKQLAALMSAWNRAGAEAREKFLAAIDTPVMERWG